MARVLTGKAPRRRRPGRSDQVPRRGAGRATGGDGGQHAEVVSSPASVATRLAQVDVGVDRLAGSGVCVFGGVLVGHRRDLHTWTGSRGNSAAWSTGRDCWSPRSE